MMIDIIIFDGDIDDDNHDGKYDDDNHDDCYGYSNDSPPFVLVHPDLRIIHLTLDSSQSLYSLIDWSL